MSKVNIYVVSHSEEDIKNIISNEIYVPLFVGRNGKDNLGFCSDDTGDNISSKNQTYCELTGLYWMWKNSDADVIGLIHYRRYFAESRFGKRLEIDELEEILKNYDIILPKKEEVLLSSVYKDYNHWHYSKDLDECENIIRDLCPEYLNSYKNIMEGNALYFYNMFIAPKYLINKYCEWIFPILTEVEKRIDTSQYSDYQKRIYGFLTERLFNVWLDKQNLKIKEQPIKTEGSIINIRMFIFKSRIVRGLYRFYVNHINENATRRY